jgi:uncharacterized membrane protein YoaK (UPF0700 family)
MLRRLPRWAWFGGMVLTCIAGMINAVGYLGFRHQAVTHLTGSTTLAGAALSSGDLAEAAHWFLIIVAFMGGAVISGIIVQQPSLKLGRPYGVALMLESLLLFAAVPLIHQQNDLGLYLASAACGLQNAMATTYSGTVLRTTHLSGSFTDVGIALGQLLRGLETDVLRLRLYLMLIASFFVGSVLGGLFFHRIGELTLLIPAALTGVAGLSYRWYRHIGAPAT